MRDHVRQWTTIPTCVGIAETKTLAKLANAATTKNPIMGGSADLRDAALRDDVMHAFSVGNVCGVGGATALKLSDLGISLKLIAAARRRSARTACMVPSTS